MPYDEFIRDSTFAIIFSILFGCALYYVCKKIIILAWQKLKRGGLELSGNIEGFAGVGEEEGVGAGGEVAVGIVDEVGVGSGSDDITDTAEVVGEGPEDFGRGNVGEEKVKVTKTKQKK